MQHMRTIHRLQGQFREGAVVKFRDGVMAGRISVLYENNFVVTSESGNTQFAFPFSYVLSVRDGVATLRIDSKAKTIMWNNSILPEDGQD